MLIYEYKLDGSKRQFAAIDEAIRIVQFIRNKCLRKWMDERGISKNDLQVSCAVLAKEYPFAARLNSQARQASADRSWFAISRFYENCKNHKPGKKAIPSFSMITGVLTISKRAGSWNPMGNISVSLMVVGLDGSA
jgi:transposase